MGEIISELCLRIILFRRYSAKQGVLMLFVLLLKINTNLRCFLRCLGLFLNVCFLMSPVIPQEDTNTEDKNIGSEEAPPRASHVTGSIVSEQFTVGNLSFLRKYDQQGKGEILEVIFDVKNKTLETLDLKLFIVGFNEQNGVNSRYRKRVPYPIWRKRDFEKDAHQIIFLDSIPKINPSDVKRVDIKTTIQGIKLNEEYASFLSYIRHIEQISNSGIPFKLYSLENIPSLGLRETSYCRITELRARTNIAGTFYMKYGLHQSFRSINHIGIIIYDAEKKKVAHRQFYRFKKAPSFR